MCSIVVLVYSHPIIENYSYKITPLVSKIEFVVKKYFSLYKITPPAKKHYSLYVGGQLLHSFFSEWQEIKVWQEEYFLDLGSIS
jgi:hypothetical protein